MTILGQLIRKLLLVVAAAVIIIGAGAVARVVWELFSIGWEGLG